MKLLMYARKRIDIRWRDFGYAFGSLLFASKRWTYDERSVTCLSVRTGLDLYLQVLNLPKGSEVIMSGMTIDDMATIVQHHGLIPIPLDLDPQTLTASSAELEACITPRTRAVIFAHLWGAIVRLDELIATAKKHNLIFIEDCAQAYIGPEYQGHPNADIALFSFGIIKTATALGGAILFLKDSQIRSHMLAREKAYPVASRWWYGKRIAKVAFLHGLSYPLPYGLFVLLCKLFGKNYDEVIAHATKGFPAADLLKEIRRQAPTALLALLAHRIETSRGDTIKLRAFVGEIFARQLPAAIRVMGHRAASHTYWVCPVIVNKPEDFVLFLQNHGFDATRVGTSVHVIEAPPGHQTAKKLEQAKRDLVYIPIYPELPSPQRQRLLAAIYDYTSGVSSKSIADVRRIQYAWPRKIIRVASLEDIQEAVRTARAHHMAVSIMGMRCNLGGHAFNNDGVILDMTEYNNIIHLDVHRKTITVQTGITWDKLQQTINPHGLAACAMQSSCMFTIGGSLGSNTHGRDLQFSSMISSVQSLKVLLADGTIKNVIPSSDPLLFGGLIGGYGLLGIILECTLSLTDNIIYQRRATIIPCNEIANYFRSRVQTDPGVGLFISEPATAPSNFLATSIVTTWHDMGRSAKKTIPLGTERNVRRDRFIFGLARSYDWGKDLLWYLERMIAMSSQGRLIARNNAMRPPATPLKFLENNSRHTTESVQEYFIPINNFQSFFTQLKPILKPHAHRILDVSNRFIRRNETSLLSYAPSEDALSVMIYTTEKRSPAGEWESAQLTRNLTSLALEHGGTYYLTYHADLPYNLMLAAYPNFEKFLALKQTYDPHGLFMSSFYEKLLRAKALQTPREKE